VEVISTRDVEKGEELVSLFANWKRSRAKDKVLPRKALKFSTKEVASPNSNFGPHAKGVYNIFVSDAQVEERDEKLRNIFEDVVRELIPSRQMRLNEYKAAESMRDRGGKLAKEARKRREQSESKLLARLAIECELVMLGERSWATFESELRGDGLADAIRESVRSLEASDSDDTISVKTAMRAWTKAKAVQVTPKRPLRVNGRRGGQKTEAQKMAQALSSGFASIRSALANEGKGNGGRTGSGGQGTKKGQRSNQRGSNGGGGGTSVCWHCGEDGHSWWEKTKCPFANKPAAPGTKHAARDAEKANLAAAGKS
jgi:hypothetical protein